MVARIAVDSGHDSALYANGVVEHLGERGEAICRARSVRDHHIAGQERGLISAQNNGAIYIDSRGRDQDLFGTSRQVDLGFFAVVEVSGAFQNNINAAPVERVGVIARKHFDRSEPEIQRAFADRNFPIEPSVHAVISHQVCAGFQRSGCVDFYHFNICAARGHNMCQNAATNATKTVNANFYCHRSHLLQILAGGLARSEGHLKFETG